MIKIGISKKNILFIFLFLSNISFFSNFSYASCYSVALLGDTGKIIKPGGLVVSMMVGKERIFVESLPNHRDKKVIGPVKCPKSLYDSILNIYNMSCTSKTAIKQTALNNKINQEDILSRCTDLKSALSSAKF